MANVARRGFLKLLGAAPIAGPVVAQEAAAKMGIGSLVSLGGQLIERTGDKPYITDNYNECRPATVAEQLASYREEIERWRSPDRRKELRRRHRHDARTLDADLASIHSMAPQRAYHIQLDRLVEREIEAEVSMLEGWMANLLGSK